ncbi:MAG: TatD family hydrolase [Ottowia sp.]|nr:TatD family hydrolase [Ottowia sp.]
MYTDSHCHLVATPLRGQFDAIWAAMQQARVTRALCISTSLPECVLAQQLAARQDGIWATAGVHPEEACAQEPAEQDLVRAASQPKVVAVGETGLDYYQMESRKGGASVADLQWQRDRFRTHIRAARRVGKPLVIHTRAAAADTLRILDEEGEDGSAGSAGGVFHCFTETLDVARAALDRGFYISMSGIITFKNAAELRSVVPFVPADRLLIETDSPYLAPVPYRGKTNTPAYVPWVAACVAKLRGVSTETIAEQTSANFDHLFLASAT